VFFGVGCVLMTPGPEAATPPSSPSSGVPNAIAPLFLRPAVKAFDCVAARVVEYAMAKNVKTPNKGVGMWHIWIQDENY